MRPQPLIAAEDVEATSRWYQKLLGCQSAHGGPEYERLEYTSATERQIHRGNIDHLYAQTFDACKKLVGIGDRSLG